MPLYVVSELNPEDSNKPKLHLVDAKTQAQALKAITEPRFTVHVAEGAELISLTKAGVEVVRA